MLKLMLVEDGRVLLELPLSTRNWDRRELKREFEDFDRDVDRVSRLFNALSNSSILISSIFMPEEGGIKSGLSISPASPLVPYTRIVFIPSAEYFTSIPPVPIDSSSG